MSKDWTGNSKAVWATLGASNHTENEREKNDYYATDGKAAEILLDVESFTPTIWENAVGGGDLADVFIKNGYKIRASDIIDRGYPNTEIIDFLTYNEPIDTDVITNPPYKIALPFVEHCLDLAQDGIKVAMFLKLQFMEGKQRKKLFEKYPPKTIYVSSSRIDCAKNGDFKKMKENGGGALAYAWYVWVKGYKGDTVVKWIN